MPKKNTQIDLIIKHNFIILKKKYYGKRKTTYSTNFSSRNI